MGEIELFAGAGAADRALICELNVTTLLQLRSGPVGTAGAFA
jgi:hypothetical protein